MLLSVDRLYEEISKVVEWKGGDQWEHSILMRYLRGENDNDRIRQDGTTYTQHICRIFVCLGVCPHFPQSPKVQIYNILALGLI